MLVLARKEGERVLIDGGRIAVEVVRIGPNAVRLGFTTPDGMSINREEIQKLVDAKAKGDCTDAK